MSPGFGSLPVHIQGNRGLVFQTSSGCAWASGVWVGAVLFRCEPPGEGRRTGRGRSVDLLFRGAIGMKVKDKVVVITGASSGIGRATALAFAAEGASVALAARRE